MKPPAIDLDTETLEELFGAVGAESVSELQDAAASSFQESKDWISSAFGRADSEELAEALHRLGGAAGLAGVQSLRQHALALEKHVRDGHDLDSLAEAIDHCLSYADDCLAAFNSFAQNWSDD